MTNSDLIIDTKDNVKKIDNTSVGVILPVV